MKDLNFTISIEETYLIMEGLGNLPFVKVHELIKKIHNQANEQLHPQESESEQSTAENLISMVKD